MSAQDSGLPRVFVPTHGPGWHRFRHALTTQTPLVPDPPFNWADDPDLAADPPDGRHLHIIRCGGRGGAA